MLNSGETACEANILRVRGDFAAKYEPGFTVFSSILGQNHRTAANAINKENALFPSPLDKYKTHANISQFSNALTFLSFHIGPITKY